MTIIILIIQFTSISMLKTNPAIANPVLPFLNWIMQKIKPKIPKTNPA